MMATSFTVREYEPEDSEQCRSLWRELTEWHREIYDDPKIGGEHPEDYFDKHLGRVGADNLWVAVDCSNVVGLIGLMVVNDETEIEPLIVSRAHRGKGVGKHLINRVIDEARKRGVRLLNIKPVARNTKTIRFLYKQGFTNLGYIELFIDLTAARARYSWKPGPAIFGCDFNY
jgi:GNAT superfamily N-acetyltransferase